jgi:tetratricopeptide (TPR) repeat protein
MSAGRSLEAENRPNDAEHSYRAALQAAGASGEKAQASLALAYLFFAAARHAESEACFRQALEHLDRPGEEFEAARARSGLALLYASMGKSAAGESAGRRAVAVLERSGDRTEAMAEAYLALADVYRTGGQPGRAGRYYQRSLRIMQSLNQDERSAMIMAQMAAVYVLDGRIRQAEDALRRALPLIEQAAGRDSPESAIAQARLGRAIAAQGRYEEAAALQRSALEILERGRGRDDVLVAKALHDLAETNRAAGRVADAEPMTGARWKSQCESSDRSIRT